MSERQPKPSRPIPRPCRTTAPFWEAAKQHKLVLQYDPDTDRYQFWPRPASVRTGRANLQWKEASGKGRLYSFTNTFVAAPGFEERVPYLVGIVELDEGVRVFSNLVNVAAAEVEIGMKMRVVWETLSPEIEFFAFEPDR